MHLPQRRHQIHISYNAICYHCSAMVRYLRRISRFLERFKANYSLVAPSNSGNRGCWGEAWLRRSSWDLFVVDGDETHSYITVIVFPRMIKWQCWISWAWLEDWTWASNPELHWSQTQFALFLSIVAKQHQDRNGINMKWFTGSNSYSMKSLISKSHVVNYVSCIVSLFEVTFKQGFEGLAEKR